MWVDMAAFSTFIFVASWMARLDILLALYMYPYLPDELVSEEWNMRSMKGVF